MFHCLRGSVSAMAVLHRGIGWRHGPLPNKASVVAMPRCLGRVGLRNGALSRAGVGWRHVPLPGADRLATWPAASSGSVGALACCLTGIGLRHAPLPRRDRLAHTPLPRQDRLAPWRCLRRIGWRRGALPTGNRLAPYLAAWGVRLTSWPAAWAGSVGAMHRCLGQDRLARCAAA